MSRKVVMQREPDESGLFSLATFQTLRLEALDLFDRSLSERKPEYFENFVQRQVVQEPPLLELLSQLAEDVHQRLLKQRQRHFDAREDIRRALLHQYGFDVTPFLPPDPLEYHRLNVDEALAFFSRQQAYLNEESHRHVQRLLQDALASAENLYAEMALTEALYTYVMDWLMALHLVTARGAWADDLQVIEPLFLQ